MGILVKKSAKKALAGKSLAGSYAVVALCIVLVLVNIFFFIFFARLLSPLAILLSNVITLLITSLSFRPVSSLIQNALVDKEKELVEKAEQEKLIEEKINALESRNLELEGKLDTRSQTAATPQDVNFTFKLEQMEFAKKGYVVREEPVEPLLANGEFAEKIPGRGLGDKVMEKLGLKEPGVRKILYIKKFYYKASIGIDFSRIKFAFDGGDILFSGVKFSRLHDITSELERDAADIDHVWVISEADGGRATILQGAEYDALKDSYARIREADTAEALEQELESLCGQYTAAFRAGICERYERVRFVDAIDDDKTWYALQEAGRNIRVREVASGMLMLSDVLGRLPE